jgi:zinc and cadmium transporter
MSLLTWIILFSLLGGVLSVVIAATFLLFPEHLRTRLLPHFISFAIGSLLGAAFLALLPHALEGVQGAEVHSITLAVLLGVLTFFLLEKMVLWRHCHDDHCEAHDPAEQHQRTTKATGSIVMIGDTVHNFVDGVLIGAAFLTDIHLGVVTAIAVAAHEIPQELGDFAVLLHSGFTRTQALIFNVLSGFATLAGALIAYYGLQDMHHLLPYALAIAASSFIYVAVADLIPGLHRRMELAATLQQIVLMSAGVLTIYIADSTLH